jgi:hypothetical protein
MMKVFVRGADDLLWREDYCYYQCGPNHGRHTKVDPQPCYTHDHERVRDLVTRCWEAFPLRGAVEAECNILSHEPIERFNGMECSESVYQRSGTAPKRRCVCGDADCTEDDKSPGYEFNDSPQVHQIILAGKRIPPMPSMTRYLVTHEYGHAAFYNTRRLMGYYDGHYARLEAAYMRERTQIPDWKHDRVPVPNWHTLPSEVIANDFRIIVMGMEPEFWPHGVEHPLGSGPQAQAAQGWWDRARKLALNLE